MNIFFVFDDGTLVDAAAGGTILPGITRDRRSSRSPRTRASRCARSAIRIDQWRADAASGRLPEAFACGTAAVVTPIGKVRAHGGEFTIGDGGPGTQTEDLKRSWSASSAATPPTCTAGSTRCFRPLSSPPRLRGRVREGESLSRGAENFRSEILGDHR